MCRTKTGLPQLRHDPKATKRTCSKCRATKPTCFFTHNGAYQHSHCLDCRNAANRAWRKRNAEKLRAKRVADWWRNVEESRRKDRLRKKRRALRRLGA